MMKSLKNQKPIISQKSGGFQSQFNSESEFQIPTKSLLAFCKSLCQRLLGQLRTGFVPCFKAFYRANPNKTLLNADISIHGQLLLNANFTRPVKMADYFSIKINVAAFPHWSKHLDYPRTFNHNCYGTFQVAPKYSHRLWSKIKNKFVMKENYFQHGWILDKI